MTDLKVRITSALLAIALIFIALMYSACDNQPTELIQTEVALTDDGTRVVYYVDNIGQTYVQHGDSEVVRIGDD